MTGIDKACDRKPRILVVEDDPNLRKVMTLVLTREGYVAEGAADGRRGLELALAEDWDCIFADYI